MTLLTITMYVLFATVCILIQVIFKYETKEMKAIQQKIADIEQKINSIEYDSISATINDPSGLNLDLAISKALGDIRTYERKCKYMKMNTKMVCRLATLNPDGFTEEQKENGLLSGYTGIDIKVDNDVRDNEIIFYLQK